MKQIEHSLTQVVSTLYPNFAGDITVERAKDITFGDYASSIAFTVAKQAGQSSHDVAQSLAGATQTALGDYATVEVADGAPFLNFKLSQSALALQMTDVVAQEESWGASDYLHSQRALVEFISANPTGPLTIANTRGGYFGDALARVLQLAGAEVEREYYMNDSGNQIVQLGRSIIAARTGEEIDDGYRGAYVTELSQIIEGDNPEVVGQAAAQYIISHWIKPMLERMGIAFDTFATEQSLMESGLTQKVIDLLGSHDLTYELEGALWLRTTKFGDDKDRVIRRSTGTTTYFLNDIAYHWDKIDRGYDQLITIVGADHFTEARALESIVAHVLKVETGWKGTFSQPIIQFVRLVRDGREVKMSKRSGTYVTIDDLLDEISSDVARFFFLMRASDSHMDFDISLAKSTSDANPVYYVQYALVRAKHILEKITDRSIQLTALNLESDERALAIHILDWSNLVTLIARTHEVHRLPYYAIELAKLFHAYYTKYPVIQAEGHLRDQRIALTAMTYITLQQVLHVIGISQPDRMVAADQNNNITGSELPES